jgi:hypothetical protein
MTTSAQSIVNRAQIALQDLAGVRWPAPELVIYLNDAQRAAIVLRPDIKSGIQSFTPVQGARQTIPSTAMSLMDVARNSAGRKRALRKADLAMMDSIDRDWQSSAETNEFVHFMYDMREPNIFYLYPPSKATGSLIEIVTSNYPVDIAAPAGATASSVVGDVDVADQWVEPLLNYVLFRAYAKDVEYGGNAAMSSAYMGLFHTALSEQLQSSTAVSPKS